MKTKRFNCYIDKWNYGSFFLFPEPQSEMFGIIWAIKGLFILQITYYRGEL